MEIAWETHQGLKRDNNQDRYLIQEYGPEVVLLAVADGMGGEAAGDQAAQIAIDSLKKFQSRRPIRSFSCKASLNRPLTISRSRCGGTSNGPVWGPP
ncbi:MAG: hypothetical protein EHM75_11510 [Desulfobacteraceae bacterium]|nr:MAG: hypothetical protein EHM75_11510 [Desulfobacteraceae bacterium]